MDTKLVKLTPAGALELLKKNTNNRPIRPTKVAALVAMFQRREYKPTHQGIAFDVNGTLLDGQHRLLALSQMPDTFSVMMNVTRGLPPETFEVIDTLTTPRSASDVLHVPAGIVAVARFIVGRLMDQAKISAMTPIYLKPYVELLDPYYATLVDYSPTITKTWSASSVRAAAILRMMEGRDRDYILLQYHALNHFEVDDMSRIVKALVRQVDRRTVNTQSLDMFARCFRAFDERKAKLDTIQLSSLDSVLEEARQIVRKRAMQTTIDHGKPQRKHAIA